MQTTRGLASLRQRRARATPCDTGFPQLYLFVWRSAICLLSVLYRAHPTVTPVDTIYHELKLRLNISPLDFLRNARRVNRLCEDAGFPYLDETNNRRGELLSTHLRSTYGNQGFRGLQLVRAKKKKVERIYRLLRTEKAAARAYQIVLNAETWDAMG